MGKADNYCFHSLALQLSCRDLTTFLCGTVEALDYLGDLKVFVFLYEVLLFACKGVKDVAVHIPVLFKGYALIFTVVKPFHIALALETADVFIQLFAVYRKYLVPGFKIFGRR